jgi:hypothetical protein
VVRSAPGEHEYLFRRARGLLVVAMIAHGRFDMSEFLPAPTADLKFVDRLLPIVFVLSDLLAPSTSSSCGATARSP